MSDTLKSLEPPVRALVETALSRRAERIEQEAREAAERARDSWASLVAAIQDDLPEELRSLAPASPPDSAACRSTRACSWRPASCSGSC